MSGTGWGTAFSYYNKSKRAKRATRINFYILKRSPLQECGIYIRRPCSICFFFLFNFGFGTNVWKEGGSLCISYFDLSFKNVMVKDVLFRLRYNFNCCIECLKPQNIQIYFANWSYQIKIGKTFKLTDTAKK